MSSSLPSPLLLLIQFLIILPIIALSVSFHEVAHGWVAYRFGDPTAKRAGRLTLNPLAHLDIWGTFILPLVFFLTLHVFFGWAKPVPVTFTMLRKPKQQMIWVALAGPMTNVCLALLAAGIFHLGRFPMESLPAAFLLNAARLNILLAIFNLIPIPPLDGSRVVMGLLPLGWLSPYARLERYGILIVFFLLSSGFLWKIILPLIEFSSRVLGLP